MSLGLEISEFLLADGAALLLVSGGLEDSLLDVDVNLGSGSGKDSLSSARLLLDDLVGLSASELSLSLGKRSLSQSHILGPLTESGFVRNLNSLTLGAGDNDLRLSPISADLSLVESSPLLASLSAVLLPCVELAVAYAISELESSA